MQKNILSRKGIAFAVIVLFIGAGFVPTIGGDYNNEQDTLSLTFYTFDRTGTKECKVDLPKEKVDKVVEIFNDLKLENRNKPKKAIINMLDTYGLIPAGSSKSDILSLLDSTSSSRFSIIRNLILEGNSLFRFSKLQKILPLSLTLNSDFVLEFGVEIFGNGTGKLFPFTLLPRPRGAIMWFSNSFAYTEISLIPYYERRYYVEGKQHGISLFFYGMGFTYLDSGSLSYFFIGKGLFVYAKGDYVWWDSSNY